MDKTSSCDTGTGNGADIHLLPIHVSLSSDEQLSLGQSSACNDEGRLNTSATKASKFSFGGISTSQFLGLVVSVLAIITVVDLLVLLKADNVSVTSVNVSLQSDHVSDASISIQSEASKSAYLSTVSLDSLSCSYYYKNCAASATDDGMDSCEPALIGDIRAELKNFDFQHEMEMQLYLENTDFPLLRQVYSDFMFDGDDAPQTSLSVSCSVGIEMQLWHSFPLKHEYSYEHEVFLEPLRLHKVNLFKLNKDSFDNLPKASDGAVQLTRLGADSLQLSILLKLATFKAAETNMQSFVVNVPSLSYSSLLVDINADADSQQYLVVQSEPLAIELISGEDEPHKREVNVVLDVSCSSADSDLACSLYSPFNVDTFRNKLAQHFVNMTSRSTERNFVSMYLGENHFVKTIDRSAAEQAYPERSRHLVAVDSIPIDNDVSSGADCVLLDVDTFYISSTCAFVEKGFFKLFLETFDNSGSMGLLESVTSWANTGGVAFVSSLAADYRNVGSLLGDVNFSEDWQNLTAVVSANSTSGVTVFGEELYSNWNFENAGETGMLRVESLTEIAQQTYTDDYNYPTGTDDHADDKDITRAVLDFTYGSSQYMLAVYETSAASVSDDDVPTAVDDYAPQSMKLFGAGAYGGSLSDWFWTLNNSYLVLNGSPQGNATARFSYDVPSSWTSGTIAHNLLVVDSGASQVLSLTGTSDWSSDSSWSNAGMVQHIMDYQYHENKLGADATLSYADNQYNLIVHESSLYYGADDDYGGDDYYSCTVSAPWNIGNGYCDYGDYNTPGCNYDGGDCCAQSCNYGNDPYNCGLYGYDCINPQYASCNVTQNDLYLIGNGNCDDEYNTPGCGYDGGDCCAQSCHSSSYMCGFNGYDCINPQYAAVPTDAPSAGDDFHSNGTDDGTYGGSSSTFVGYAAGTYGGSQVDWFWTLNNSYLVLNGSPQGNATGRLSYDVPSSWTSGTIAHILYLDDSSAAQVMMTSSNTNWHSDSSWSETGVVSHSLIWKGNSTELTASGVLDYGDNAYSLLANQMTVYSSDDDYNYGDDGGSNTFQGYVRGGYGGTSSDWYVM